MRKPLVVLLSVMLMWSFLCACAKDLYERVEMRQSFFETDAVNRSYVKKAAIVLNHGSATPPGGQIETLFLQSLIETIRGEDQHLNLISIQDPAFPSFMKSDALFSPPANIHDLAEAARLQGYHYLLDAGLWHIEPIRKKTGVWVFRKERAFINRVVALDVYDTFTGAKILSRVEDNTVKIGLDAYEDLMAGVRDGITVVEEALVDDAKRLGEEAASAMGEGGWKASVTAVEGDRVILAADREAGLRPGDRLAVYEARRVVSGPNGERYIAPGYKLVDIRIAAFEEGHALGTMEQPAGIQAGDIAVPAD